jgi:hypothetical protein
MAIAVTKLQGLHAAGARPFGVVERVGSRCDESRLAFLFPYGVQRLESRC